MNWVIYTFIGTGVLYLFIIGMLLITNRKKSVGLGQFSRTVEQVEGAVSTQIAPAPFYYKQRTFRLCYGILHTLDKLLLVTSIVYSAITAYLILDTTISNSLTVVCLVISSATSTLKASLNLDRMAKPYIEAVRIMEKAILRYEYSDISITGSLASNSVNPFQILLDANEEAEKLISMGNE